MRPLVVIGLRFPRAPRAPAYVSPRYLKANPNDLRGLARLLGHASLNTVMVYTEPNLADLAQRMERVEIVDN